MFGDVAFAQAPFAALGGATLLSSVAETATASASIAQETRAGSLIQEFLSASAEFISLNNIVASNQQEAATAADSLAFVASTLNATQAETATGTDAPAFAASTLNALITESAIASNAQAAIATMFAVIAEIATGSDASNRGLLVTAAVTETATGSAVVSVTTSVNAAVEELVSALDAYGNLKIANVYPAGLQLNVYAGNVLIWGTIPTDQTPPDPNWQVIPT